MRSHGLVGAPPSGALNKLPARYAGGTRPRTGRPRRSTTAKRRPSSSSARGPGFAAGFSAGSEGPRWKHPGFAPFVGLPTDLEGHVERSFPDVAEGRFFVREDLRPAAPEVRTDERGDRRHLRDQAGLLAVRLLESPISSASGRSRTTARPDPPPSSSPSGVRVRSGSLPMNFREVGVAQ